MLFRSIQQALADHPVTAGYLFHVLVSPDVPVEDNRLALWGWFTRFDPYRDFHATRQIVEENRLRFEPPFMIDATWKKGYRKPVAFDPDIAALVDKKWESYGIRLPED